MKGYDFVRNMADTEISSKLQVNIRQAIQIRNCSMEEMKQNEYICPQMVKKGHYECMDKVAECRKCRENFLESEVNYED